MHPPDHDTPGGLQSQSGQLTAYNRPFTVRLSTYL